ncbi:MAG: NADH-quinone oxidoreductase subunit A [Acidobacteria bacterium]|nr:NADH-quinone oxidoreductase subunit A [Acidobacteriota bacterium]
MEFEIWNLEFVWDLGFEIFRRPKDGGDLVDGEVCYTQLHPWVLAETGSGNEMDRYFGFVVLVSFALMTTGAMLAISHWLGPRRHSRVHDMPFECGVEPRQIMRGRFSVKFFVVALVFVLFDIELIFLFAWAVVYKELGLFGFTEMLVFLLVVLSGLFYSVKRGIFEWK